VGSAFLIEATAVLLQADKVSGKNNSNYFACRICHSAAFGENYVQNRPEYFWNQTTCLQGHHMEFGVIGFDHEAA